MSDEADKQARELADHCRYCGMPDYRPKCKQDYEDSVRDIAALLREKDVEIVRLKALAEANFLLGEELRKELRQAKAKK